MKKISFFIALILALASMISFEAKAQIVGFRVTRVPGLSETPSNYYGVDYPAAASYTRPTGGYLSIKDVAGTEIAIWAPGQWVRVERIPAPSNTP